MDSHKNRVLAFEEEYRKKEIDSFFVSDETNVSYLSGFAGEDSFLLFMPDKRFFITDSRYIEEAESTVRDFKVELVEVSTYETLKVLIAASGVKKVGFESMDLPYEVASRLKSFIAGVEFIPLKGLIEGLRTIKDRGEINLVKKSINVTRNVFDRIIKLVKPGVTERSLRNRIEFEFIKEGANAGFEPIVASGTNSSKPHARPTDTKIRKNSFVMIDIGCKLKGYNSDLTRMVLTGKVKDKIKKIYNIVREAQEKALDGIRPGARIADVDKAARGHIAKHGFGKYFGHSLGHGVGMEVHEEPTISNVSEGILRPGMVFTVEPAIYIPKLGGVRIEDIVLVTNEGYELLTR